MRGTRSPGTGARYPLTLICRIFRVSRSSVYAVLTPPAPAGLPGKRGPKTRWSDAEIVDGIRTILTTSPFHGEGYRKVRARLAHRGLAVGGKRVLRLMRQHGLLAPRLLGPPNGDPAHAGQIITDRPDVMWGTDATRFYRPVPMGSATPTNTMGTVVVASFAARLGPSAPVTISCTSRRSRSATRAGSRSAFPSENRRSMVRFWPST